MNRIQEMEINIDKACKQDINYMVLEIMCYENREMIIISKENFITKLDYYKKTYDDDLVMRNNNNIRINRYMFSNKIVIHEKEIT